MHDSMPSQSHWHELGIRSHRFYGKSDGTPGEEVVSFPADVNTIYTSAKLVNAPDNTQVRIEWTYVTGNQPIDSVVLDSGDISSRYIYSNLDLTEALPEGDYQVQYFIEDRKEPDATVKFVVVAGAKKDTATDGAYLEDAHMTSGMDASGMPLDSITTLPTTGTWYVSSILRNAQSDTKIHYVWYDTETNVIDNVAFDPEGATDVYIFGTFELASIAPEGQYRVELYIDDATQPAASVDFTVSSSIVNTSPASAGVTLYSQKEGGFSLKYPSSWVLQEFTENEGAMIYPVDAAIANENDINTAYVYANKGTGAGYTSETLLQAWIDETVAEKLENYAYIAKAVDTINGKEIASYSYSWSRGSYQLYTVDALILNGDDFYVLTLTTTQDQYDAIYPLFEQMVLSFQIL